VGWLPEFAIPLPVHDHVQEVGGRAGAPWGALLRQSSLHRCPAGAVILHQGFRAESVYLVRAGLVKLLCACPDGRTTIVGLRHRGSLLGTEAVLLGESQPLTAIALTSCELARIPAGELSSLLRHGDTLSWEVHQEHCREVQRQLERVVALACLSARERLDEFLRLLWIAIGPEGDDPTAAIELPLRDWELAQFLAITPQYLSRLMHELADEGRLRRRGSRWLFSGACRACPPLAGRPLR
jgi:CRP-like cAMP-binding protein